MHVALMFEDDWRIGSLPMTEDERRLVQRVALRTLETAYAGFDVQFGGDGERVIRVENARYVSPGPGAMAVAGAVGVTYPVFRESTVHPETLFGAELLAAGCPELDACATKSRQQLLEGLGHGIGATAAHELGHQAGLRFSRDSLCDECYDGHRATTYVHFFGVKRWSTDALSVMRRELRSTDAR
jgi:hypothetical protein